MNNFISAYIASKISNHYCKSKVIKDGNKYICRYLSPNKHYDENEYRTFKRSAEEESIVMPIIGTVIIFITAAFCMIPHILGVITFTLINVLIICMIMHDNKYRAIVYGSIWICLFLVVVFCTHFILSGEDINPICYQMFHKIYPEYLFKFKFKWLHWSSSLQLL